MKKSKAIGITVASVLVLAMCFIALPAATPQSAQASPPLPIVTGPILPASGAFDPAAGTNYESRGYVQEEYFISGTANEYDLDFSDNTSFAVHVRTPDLPYKTRILVRRPADPSLFSGNVIVEFMNPSGGYDIATAWACYFNQIMRNGDVWVGVTCKNTIVFSTCSGFPQGLKVFNFARYGTLFFSKDRAQAWDIFTQLGALLKTNDLSNPLVQDGLSLSNLKLIGHGYSQTGGYLITYINFFHKDAKIGSDFIYDGYLASAAAGPIWINDDGVNPCVPSMGFGPFSASDPRRVIQPCGVPVMHTLTETEIAIPAFASPDMNAIITRRADSDTSTDLFRRYEIAGACHKGAGSPGPTHADLVKTMGYECPWCCYGTHSDFPVQYIHNGILVNMENWIRSGTPPPPGAIITTASGSGIIVRDAFGNAQGGVRTPYVDVPIKRYFPMSAACPSCTPASLCGGCSAWCVILGNVAPLPPATLESLYGDHDGYVDKFNESTQKLFKNGWVTKEDRQIMKLTAAKSDVLK
ncbi:MAG: alpha/beta hydrolase domain-containing protein [Dehalococcoidia bacterium]